MFQLSKLQQEVSECNIQSESYRVYFEEERRTNEMLRNRIKQYEGQEVEKDYMLWMPQVDLTTIKKSLKTADSYILTSIIEYLKLDTYELVKNLSKVVNKWNAAETIAYRDGAIGRNEALSKLLSESNVDKSFVNRIKGEVDYKG